MHKAFLIYTFTMIGALVLFFWAAMTGVIVPMG